MSFFSDLTLGFYSWIRKRRFRKNYPILLRLLDPKKEDVILDVGAGTGVLANEVANISDDVFALEPNADRVEYIKKKFPQVKAFDGSAESISFPEAYFTKVYILSAFHHFTDQDGALYEINRVLKKKGVLVIFDLPLSKSSVESRLATIKFLAPEELEEKLELAGFSDVETKNAEKGYFVRAMKA